MNVLALRPKTRGQKRLASEPREVLGRGRSGVVFKTPAADGSHLAVKVFTGERLSNLVHRVLTGAPNAYTWNEHAVRCAVLRRQILADLLCYWFTDRVALARATGDAWNDEHRAYELHAEFVEGRPAALIHPFSCSREEEHRELVEEVMRPLQRHLTESGFDGLVWQAGRGNPVATNNFLLCEEDGQRRCWKWIDLESGVPALFPINPVPLFSFYLPRSVKHRRPLFDDVDVPKLRAYLQNHTPRMQAQRATHRPNELCRRIDELEREQAAWKAMRRANRGITYQLSQGRISDAQADWYRQHVPQWYAREIVRVAKAAPGKAVRGIRRTISRITAFPYGRAVRVGWRLLTSQRYRAARARRHVARRIRDWQSRGQLNRNEARLLRDRLAEEESSSYLADFGMHLAFKPFAKTTQWGVIAPLMVAGVIDPLPGGLLLLGGGTALRSAYTLLRLVQATLRGREKPWAALFLGLVPVLGTLAYPLQVLYSSGNSEGGDHSRGKVAQFIVFEKLSRIGELLPIWGGSDTRTEHALNRLAARVVRCRKLVDVCGPTDTERGRNHG